MQSNLITPALTPSAYTRPVYRLKNPNSHGGHSHPNITVDYKRYRSVRETQMIKNLNQCLVPKLQEVVKVTHSKSPIVGQPRLS